MPNPPFSRGVAASWLLIVFIVCGPIYWLPGISMDVLHPLEESILLVALSLVFGPELLQRRLPLPAGLLGPLGFAGLGLLWIPGIVQARKPFDVFELVGKLGLTMAFFWCFYVLAVQNNDVFAIFRRAFLILVLLVAGALIAALATTVDWGSPCDWDSIYVMGFGLTSTGWSFGLAMFVPIAALFTLPSQGRRSFIAGLGVVVLIASELVSGGRGGVLTSLLVLVGFALLRYARWLVAVCIAAGLLASVVYWDQSCHQHLRLYLISSAEGSVFTSMNTFSTRRLQGYITGLEKIRERPLCGHGLFQVMLETPYERQTEIHNLWIKWGAYTGVGAPLLLLLMVALILRAGWRIWWEKQRSLAERHGAAALGLVILSGLFISQLEVNIPIGAFQLSAIWWAAAGTLVGIADCTPSQLRG